MDKKQTFFILVFVSGLGAFFYFGSEVLAKHSDWNSFSTPMGMSDIFRVLASVTATVGAALGINLSEIIKGLKK
jgi:hypothetical protein